MADDVKVDLDVPMNTKQLETLNKWLAITLHKGRREEIGVGNFGVTSLLC